MLRTPLALPRLAAGWTDKNWNKGYVSLCLVRYHRRTHDRSSAGGIYPYTVGQERKSRKSSRRAKDEHITGPYFGMLLEAGRKHPWFPANESVRALPATINPINTLIEVKNIL